MTEQEQIERARQIDDDEHAELLRRQASQWAPLTSDQAKLDALVAMMNAGEWKGAASIADHLVGFCDLNGVLCEFPKLAPLLEAIERAALYIEAAQADR